MLLTTLVLALAVAADEPVPTVVVVGAAQPASPAWRVDAPLTLTAAPASSNSNTVVAPWVGLRAGGRLSLIGPMVVGGEGALHVGGLERSGTSNVAVTRVLSALEARGLAGASLATASLELLPYAWTSLVAGAGVAFLSAFDDGRVRPLGTLGGRVGVGAELRLLHGTARLEVGGGLRDLRPELSTSFALGVAL